MSVAACRYFTDSGADREGFRCQNRVNKLAITKKGANREPARAKEPSNTHFRNEVEQVSKTGCEKDGAHPQLLDALFRPKL